MNLDNNTPVLVGIGEMVEAVPEKLETASSPISMAASVAELALQDAGISAQEIDTLLVLRTMHDSTPMLPVPHGSSSNPPGAVAKRLGAQPTRLIYTQAGGQSPQQLVNEWVEKLDSGDAELVLITGAEAMATSKAAQRAKVPLDWTETVEGDFEQRGIGLKGLLGADEIRHGMAKPPTQYAVAENARRANLGQSVQQHSMAMGELFAPFSEVASTNPYAMFKQAYTAAEIATPSDKNGYVDFPYTYRMVAKEGVNQAAALILTTVGKAKELGIDNAKWVYLHAYAQANDLPILQRENLGSSKALTLTYQHVLQQAGVSIDDIDVLDLYSCFPIAVELAKEALGITDPNRQLTQTGGLPFFGGPGSCYSMHGITSVLRKLRDNPQQMGLVGANGGMINKHAVGIYSCKPGWKRCYSDDIQREALVQDSPLIDPDPNGRATIESYTVSFMKGMPVHAVVVGRLLKNNARFVACNSRGDAEVLERLLKQDCIRQEIVVASTAQANIIAFDQQALRKYLKPAATQFRENYEYCNINVNAHILEITIDRQAAHNALTPQANDELAEVFDVYMSQADLRVAIVTGAGDKAFCSGNDLKYAASGKPLWVPKSGFGGLTARVGRNKPVIAAVNGFAMGGGFEIALAADVIVASEQAQFGLPEVKRGLIAAAGGIIRLCRQIPEKLAMEMLLTGRSVSSHEGKELGFVNHVVSPDQLMPFARKLAEVIAQNSPTSIRLTFDMLAEKANHGDSNVAAFGMADVLDELITSEDFYEGSKAFAQKRQPQWTGN